MENIKTFMHPVPHTHAQDCYPNLASTPFQAHQIRIIKVLFVPIDAGSGRFFGAIGFDLRNHSFDIFTAMRCWSLKLTCEEWR
ncbi:hypothetical protein AB6818_04545 [Carnobacterium maltaromaticum]